MMDLVTTSWEKLAFQFHLLHMQLIICEFDTLPSELTSPF